jgi:hypothetical protein
MTQIAYKLVKQRRDGTLGPLFINATQRIPLGEWLPAEAHRRKGYAYRPGWHCCYTMEDAPHLKQHDNNRVWMEVEVRDFTFIQRPASQGGAWILANEIRFLRIIP